MLYSLWHLLIYSWSDSYLLLTHIRSNSMLWVEKGLTFLVQINITSAEMSQTLAALIPVLFIHIQLSLTSY